MYTPRAAWLTAAVCTLALLLSGFATAEDWPQFRGPTGGGVPSDKELPLVWGGPKNENVVWTADLLGEGIASPLVWKDRLFVVNASRKEDDKAANRKEPEQYVACYDTATGKLLWNAVVPHGPRRSWPPARATQITATRSRSG